jgi:hypothetical protein
VTKQSIDKSIFLDYFASLAMTEYGVYRQAGATVAGRPCPAYPRPHRSATGGNLPPVAPAGKLFVTVQQFECAPRFKLDKPI